MDVQPKQTPRSAGMRERWSSLDFVEFLAETPTLLRGPEAGQFHAAWPESCGHAHTSCAKVRLYLRLGTLCS